MAPSLTQFGAINNALLSSSHLVTRKPMTLSLTLPRFSRILLAFVILSSSPAIYAEDAPTLPPWLTLSLTKKILDIDMTEEQRTLFRSSLTECLEGLRADVTKIIRRGGANLPKKVERARKNRFN